jgi:hypothetical protein
MEALMRNLLFGFVFLASCTTSPTSEVAVNREALKLQISAFEGGISPERLASLDGDVAGALIALSSDFSERPFFRSRAMKALSHYPEDRVFQHLRLSLSHPETLGFVVLPETIQSFSLFGERYPDEVTEILAPLTTNQSLVVKEFTVRALSVTPSLRAKTLLAEMALKETEPSVQNALRIVGALR